jgi:nitrite reductase/ring-hydroxylating ferredoxin subunit
VATRTRTRQAVAIPKAQLPAGERTVITVRRREILVINDGGQVHAMFNRCPHQQAPMLRGRITGTNAATPVGQFSFDPSHRVLRCPWHHYEYDLADGLCLADRARYRIAIYEVQETDDDYVVLV